MTATKAFLDTNILIYIFTVSEVEKRKQSIEKINNYDRIVSTQILTEFCSVSIRKLKMDLSLIEEAINLICLNNTLVVVNLDTIKYGLYIQNKYNFSYYDSLIIASALVSNCEFLLSEGMNNGQVIEKTLTIRNIFSPVNLA
ncbi:MAG: PIN domain-containing protein [Deltaproteobacteria bacterium]|jgi:predicted nucleic acid-binding protein|nr:PIN domain-containing protein [Deltaproteobacteria bacterium]